MVSGVGGEVASGAGVLRRGGMGWDVVWCGFKRRREEGGESWM